MPTQVSMPPQPSALVASLRSIGYSLETAIADIIDNSITAEAKQVSVRFGWNNGDPWLAVIDNGYGMTSAELQVAMRFGSKDPGLKRKPSDLGRFGMGMKTASISQCRRLTVCSKSKGTLSAFEWNLDQISEDIQLGWTLVNLDKNDISKDTRLSTLLADQLANSNNGTIVLWRILDVMLHGENQVENELAFNSLLSNDVRKHISTTFHRFLSPDPGHTKLLIDFNNNPLKSFNPFGIPSPARQELNEEIISVAQGDIRIQPYILPHRNKVSYEEYQHNAGDEGYLQNQGFYVYRNRRLILKSTWFRLIRKQENTKLIRIRIDIPNSLDDLWLININKSNVSPPPVVRTRLRKLIDKIADRGKRVYKQRAVNLHNKTKSPIWNRVLQGNKVRYDVNLEHPLIERLLNSISDEITQQMIKSSYALMSSEFPYDILFHDLTTDGIDMEEELINDANVQMYRSMIQYLRIQNINDEDIIKSLSTLGLATPSEDTLTLLLNEKD